MGFDVTADAYQQFMGRFSEPLSEPFLRFARVAPGDRALDVGCGPGVLTERLADLLGADRVAAVEPVAPFVEAARHRCPGVDVRQASAESLPYDDGAYDAALAQLVVHFMSDPVAGLREMGRVVRPGGVVAACVWDHAGGRGPLSPYWQAVKDLDPSHPGEGLLAGATEGDLERLCAEAGLVEVEGDLLTVVVPQPSFEAWFAPYTLGVGPAGDHYASLDEDARAAVRARCAELLPEGPFDASAGAWAVRARVA